MHFPSEFKIVFELGRQLKHLAGSSLLHSQQNLSQDSHSRLFSLKNIPDLHLQVSSACFIMFAKQVVHFVGLLQDQQFVKQGEQKNGDSLAIQRKSLHLQELLNPSAEVIKLLILQQSVQLFEVGPEHFKQVLWHFLHSSRVPLTIDGQNPSMHLQLPSTIKAFFMQAVQKFCEVHCLQLPLQGIQAFLFAGFGTNPDLQTHFPSATSALSKQELH